MMVTKAQWRSPGWESGWGLRVKSKVREDFLDHVGVFDGCDNLHLASANGAGIDIDIEDSFQKPCPTHSRWALRRGTVSFRGHRF